MEIYATGDLGEGLLSRGYWGDMWAFSLTKFIITYALLLSCLLTLSREDDQRSGVKFYKHA
jgi:hypothetical protein